MVRNVLYDMSMYDVKEEEIWVVVVVFPRKLDCDRLTGYMRQWTADKPGASTHEVLSYHKSNVITFFRKKKSNVITRMSEPNDVS